MISSMRSYVFDNIRVAQGMGQSDIIHDIIVFFNDIVYNIVYDISIKKYDIMHKILIRTISYMIS